MAFLQNPRQRRTFAPDADAGGPVLPDIPGTGTGLARPQAFQGARQLAGLSDAFHQSIAARRAPVTDQTPVSELQRRVAGTRFNFTPGNGNGASWQDSPDGLRTFHDEPTGFLRPRTGPESAAAVGQRTELANLAGPVQVADLPARPVLALPGGVTTTAAPVRRPAGAAALAPAAPAPAATLQRPSAGAAPPAGLPGELVDGVRVLSDGSHGIARTVTDQQIKDAAASINVAPAPLAPLASDVLGYTPTSSDMANRRLAQLTRPVTGARPTEADFAASERNAIASGDPRSAAGTAASNLRQDAAYARTPRLRRIAEAQLDSLSAGAQQSGALAQQGEQQQAVLDAQGQNALDVADLQGQYGLAEAKTQLQRPRAGNPVTLADGTLALQDPYNGQVTRSIGPDGKPARAMVTRDDSATRRTQEIQDQLARTAAELAKNYLPPPGSPADAPPPYGQFREQAARLQGLSVVKNKAGDQLVNINGQWMPL